MTKKRTRIKIKSDASNAIVTCLIKHPMETGNRKDNNGKLVPRHYVKYIRFTINDEWVTTANLGPGISTDPLISVTISDIKPGDKVSAEWIDNKGEGDRIEALVK